MPLPTISTSLHLRSVSSKRHCRERTLKLMLKRKAITPERVELLQNWQHSGFNLNPARRVAAGDPQSLETLLQYIERPPVSLRRLTYRPDGMVHYLGTRFHPALGRNHQLVTPVEFLAMLVPHIALRYEVKIRTYGALSTTTRQSHSGKGSGGSRNKRRARHRT